MSSKQTPNQANEHRNGPPEPSETKPDAPNTNRPAPPVSEINPLLSHPSDQDAKDPLLYTIMHPPGVANHPSDWTEINEQSPLAQFRYWEFERHKYPLTREDKHAIECLFCDAKTVDLKAPGLARYILRMWVVTYEILNPAVCYRHHLRNRVLSALTYNNRNGSMQTVACDQLLDGTQSEPRISDAYEFIFNAVDNAFAYACDANLLECLDGGQRGIDVRPGANGWQVIWDAEQQTKGVSFKDAALLICEGDWEAATKTVARWQRDKSGAAPISIGFAIEHEQVKLYKPPALAAFILKKDPGIPFTQVTLKERLTGLARLPKKP